MKKQANGLALIPFLVFVVFYLATGIILSAMGVEMAFYQVPSPISITIGIIVAFFMFSGTVDEKVGDFVKGCGDENIIIMCMIYLLAGAFATVCGATGAVESVVNLFLSIIPVQYIAAGIFLICAFLSTATGSSVGTIIPMAPIAVGIADKSGIGTALLLGAVVGGAMAGDNLSIISDTTIAATRTQNVNMKDKFIMNIRIALPAIIITFVILLFAGRPEAAVDLSGMELSYNVVKILPYLFVIIAAMFSMNVLAVLLFGVVIASVIGLAYGNFDLLGLAGKVYEGFTSPTETFLLSMLTGGLAYMVRKEGGIEWLILKLRNMIKGTKTAEFAFSLLTCMVNLCVANNTVSILIAGPVAKDLSPEYEVDPRRNASLLDTFSCVIQGLIPYGAQLLIAAGATNGKVSPVEIVPYVWYCFLLAIFAVLSIFVRFAQAKNKWDYEADEPTVAM